MIIDDSSLDRKLIRSILEKRLPNLRLFEAENGLNLKAKLLENNIHMCILDILMPVKDGFEVLEELKEDSLVKDIPVIVCTGIDDVQAIEKALTLGAYDYFSKPLSDDDMRTSLPLKVKNAIELMKRNQEIQYLSYHDGLTGIYNRRKYEEEILRLDTPNNLPITVIMGDINGLKLINDTFGHNQGDVLLKKAAAIIQSACQSGDIVARWGGDEFIILLTNTQRAEAEMIVKRIKELYSLEKVSAIYVSISFGWDTKESMDQDIAKILKNAEDYMYRNKTLEIESVRSKMITTIIKTLHEKNPREEKHSKRVSELCQEIGRAIDLPEVEINKLKAGGLLHDIGKIAIDEGILNKPGRLDEQEWEQIKRHPSIGYRILSTSHEMLELAEGILLHHERWDGSGYPLGLKGDAIPIISRIIAIADSYDAMTSERPYRTSMSEEVALGEIQKYAGIQFDPTISSIFVEKIKNNEIQLLYS